MDTMHAVRGHRRGGPEQLTYEIAPRPVPGRGEVLVGVRSASITPDELDWDATWTDSLDGSGSERVPIVAWSWSSRAGLAVNGISPYTSSPTSQSDTSGPSSATTPDTSFDGRLLSRHRTRQAVEPWPRLRKPRPGE
ncbi:hypothetical protein [Streptomyces sp. NBC_00271]|uniref:hypothetical protein n=1 Tax=Streptomyces sp. NBC_00271 TaxID=2975697 RepID=UPI002E29B04A|nr:hypothetical protein [Streptomyces sp. NBC_00271]